MCLDSLDATLPDVTFGYKVFRKLTERERQNVQADLTVVFDCIVHKQHYSYGQNHFADQSKPILLTDITNDWYATGFHCFYNKSDAEEYLRLINAQAWEEREHFIVVRVEVENILAKGLQRKDFKISRLPDSFYKCFVAQFITLPERPATE